MTRLVALLAAAVLLAGCTGSDEPDADPTTTPTGEVSATSPSTPARAELPPRPRERACYRLGYDDAVAPTSSRGPVDCAGPHTSMTFFVGTLDAVVDGHLLAVDSDRVQQQVATECPRRLGTAVGGTVEQRRLSMLRAVWFTPSVEQSDAGADWFRCDVIAVAGAQVLAPLSGRLAGVLDSEAGRERYGMCGTAEPGTEDFERVVCAAEHSWRAIATVPFAPGDYPGLDRVRPAGEAPCEDAGRAIADDPLSFRWGYEWPTREQWRSGQTYGICWAPV